MNFSCAIFTPVISGEVHPSCTRSLNRLFKNPVLHIYKTRRDNSDEYSFELTDSTTGTKAEISKVFDKPDFVDAWVPVRADSRHFALNIRDITKIFGYIPGGSYGLCTQLNCIDKDGDAPETPYLKVETHVHYRDESGNVTDFKCNGADYLEKLAEWYP